jgi:hypothetical protein
MSADREGKQMSTDTLTAEGEAALERLLAEPYKPEDQPYPWLDNHRADVLRVLDEMRVTDLARRLVMPASILASWEENKLARRETAGLANEEVVAPGAKASPRSKMQEGSTARPPSPPRTMAEELAYYRGLAEAYRHALVLLSKGEADG